MADSPSAPPSADEEAFAAILGSHARRMQKAKTRLRDLLRETLIEEAAPRAHPVILRATATVAQALHVRPSSRHRRPGGRGRDRLAAFRALPGRPAPSAASAACVGAAAVARAKWRRARARPCPHQTALSAGACGARHPVGARVPRRAARVGARSKARGGPTPQRRPTRAHPLQRPTRSTARAKVLRYAGRRNGAAPRTPETRRALLATYPAPTRLEFQPPAACTRVWDPPDAACPGHAAAWLRPSAPRAARRSTAPRSRRPHCWASSASPSSWRST